MALFPSGVAFAELGAIGSTPPIVPRIGCAIWQESIDDLVRQAGTGVHPPMVAAWAGNRPKLERRVVVHEIAHLFNIGHTGGIMGSLFSNDELYDFQGNPKFTDAQIDKLRSRVKSPGK